MSSNPNDAPTDEEIVEGIMAKMDGERKKVQCCTWKSKRVLLAKELDAAQSRVLGAWTHTVPLDP